MNDIFCFYCKSSNINRHNATSMECIFYDLFCNCSNKALCVVCQSGNRDGQEKNDDVLLKCPGNLFCSYCNNYLKPQQYEVVDNIKMNIKN